VTPSGQRERTTTAPPPVPKIVEKAKKSKVQVSAFAKDDLNRAVARFVATHKWAKKAGKQSDDVRRAAAFLLSKENSFYGAKAGEGAKHKRARSTDNLGGPDSPTSGR